MSRSQHHSIFAPEYAQPGGSVIRASSLLAAAVMIFCSLAAPLPASASATAVPVSTAVRLTNALARAQCDWKPDWYLWKQLHQQFNDRREWSVRYRRYGRTVSGTGPSGIDVSRAEGTISADNDLDGWRSTKPLDVILRSIFQPLTVIAQPGTSGTHHRRYGHSTQAHGNRASVRQSGSNE